MSHWILPLDLPYTEACEPVEVEDSVHVYVEPIVDGKPYALVRFTLPACEFTLHGLGPKELAKLGQFLINTADELKEEVLENAHCECGHARHTHHDRTGYCKSLCACMSFRPKQPRGTADELKEEVLENAHCECGHARHIHHDRTGYCKSLCACMSFRPKQPRGKDVPS